MGLNNEIARGRPEELAGAVPLEKTARVRIAGEGRPGEDFAMPYVVKNKLTGCYLRSTGEWTRYLTEAQQFPNGRSVPLHLEGNQDRSFQNDVEILRLPLG